MPRSLPAQCTYEPPGNLSLSSQSRGDLLSSALLASSGLLEKSAALCRSCRHVLNDWQD